MGTSEKGGKLWDGSDKVYANAHVRFRDVRFMRSRCFELSMFQDPYIKEDSRSLFAGAWRAVERVKGRSYLERLEGNRKK